jgi:hypothetical protein
MEYDRYRISITTSEKKPRVINNSLELLFLLYASVDTTLRKTAIMRLII